MSGRTPQVVTIADEDREGSTPFPGVRHVIGIAGGKGGVGKSTIAVNLALALAALGSRCGLLDADMYGPSVPIMLGLRDGRLRIDADGRIAPLEIHGVKVVSVGFMVPEAEALIWRGAILDKVVTDFLHDVRWEPLDYLVVDLPPGTGDVPLSLHRAVRFAGVVLVTTPQAVATVDVARSFALCRETGAPLLGLVENMCGFTCPHCRGQVDLFASGAARDLSEQLGIPLLGRIAFDPEIGFAGDLGLPWVAARPDSPTAAALRKIARSLAQRLPLS